MKNEVKLARADGGGEELELEDGTLGRRSHVGQAGVVDRSSSSRTACGCCCLLVPGGRRRAGETRQRSRPGVARRHGTMGEFEVKTGHDESGD